MQRTRTAKKQQQLFVEEVIKHFGVFLCVCVCVMSALDSQAGKKGCTQYFCKPSTKFDLFSYAIWIVCSSKIKAKLGWLNPNSHNVHDLALKQWLNIIFRKHFNYSDRFASSWHITYKTYNFCFWKTKSNCHWEKLKEKKKNKIKAAHNLHDRVVSIL